jgi:uncharacterized repeat protein (TIGR01451 family)
MHDVAMRRRPAGVVIAALLAMLVVGGALLLWTQQAQAQSDPEPPCNAPFCVDKTANPSTVTVGELITFTITQRCPGIPPGCLDTVTLVDQLPPDAGLTDVSVPAGCTLSGNTITCPGPRFFTSTQPYTLTIVATPTECGTFTKTASAGPDSGEVTFTVVQCVLITKAQCKKGGWSNPALGWPDQGTCISAWNKQNRP